MFRTRKRPLALMLVMSLLLNLMPVTTANAEAARRQTVIERTLNYSKGVDLIDVRQKAASSFRGNVGVAPKVFSDEAKANAKLGDCGGFTVKRGEGCEGQNIPCCGKEECYLPCRVNGSLSHGDKNFCLEAKQFSDIYGRSCCGEEDCKFTDINYRIDVCNGYTQTSKGLPCCGKDDCSQKECNYHTETTGEYGGSGTAGLKCCGDQDCHLKECDNNVYGTKPDGTEVACCGKDDCHYRKCDGLIKVDSKVDDKKDISCCGADDCHLKECNNKISTDTVSGSVDVPCCGEKQCWAKHCDGKTVVQTKDGLEECCGQEDCDKKACDPVTYKGMDGTEKICCRKNEDCSAKQCSLDEFWDSFDSVRITQSGWGVMGSMGGIVCSSYNINYSCQVLDKNGNVVRGCSASDTRSIQFGGYLNPCMNLNFGHSPVINVVVPINGSCSVSMQVQLPYRSYYCAILPIGGGCDIPAISYVVKQNSLK